MSILHDPRFQCCIGLVCIFKSAFLILLASTGAIPFVLVDVAGRTSEILWPLAGPLQVPALDCLTIGMLPIGIFVVTRTWGRNLRPRD